MCIMVDLCLKSVVWRQVSMRIMVGLSLTVCRVEIGLNVYHG